VHQDIDRFMIDKQLVREAHSCTTSSDVTPEVQLPPWGCILGIERLAPEITS